MVSSVVLFVGTMLSQLFNYIVCLWISASGQVIRQGIMLEDILTKISKDVLRICPMSCPESSNIFQTRPFPTKLPWIMQRPMQWVNDITIEITLLLLEVVHPTWYIQTCQSDIILSALCKYLPYKSMHALMDAIALGISSTCLGQLGFCLQS